MSVKLCMNKRFPRNMCPLEVGQHVKMCNIDNRRVTPILQNIVSNLSKESVSKSSAYGLTDVQSHTLTQPIWLRVYEKNYSTKTFPRKKSADSKYVKSVSVHYTANFNQNLQKHDDVIIKNLGDIVSLPTLTENDFL